jgi:hypothetical protein
MGYREDIQILGKNIKGTKLQNYKIFSFFHGSFFKIWTYKRSRILCIEVGKES